MTDAQYLFDLAAKQYNETAEVIERHFEHVADQIRDWIPAKVPFSAPPPPPQQLTITSYVSKLQSWAVKHKAIAAGVVAFIGTGAVYLFIQRQAYRRKRRARRTANGARTEVVVIAGMATSTMTTELALDLERRGYIVYVVTNTEGEWQHVRNLPRVEVQPIRFDADQPALAQDQISRLRDMLQRHHSVVQGEPSYRLKLSGVVIIPETQYQTGLVTDVAPQDWADALNAKVLNTIVATQHLYPLITDFSSRVLLLAPSIIPSLNPPGHAVQSTVAGALQGFSASLAAELQTRHIRLSTFKLGHLELNSDHARVAGGKARQRGTPLRKLHDSVFDALQSSRPSRTWHVGRGSLTYDLVGSWLPAGIVGWMLGRSNRRATSSDQKVIEMVDGSNSESSVQWEKVDRESEQSPQQV